MYYVSSELSTDSARRIDVFTMQQQMNIYLFILWLTVFSPSA